MSIERLDHLLAIFGEGPARAFDRLSEYFDAARVAGTGGTLAPSRILHVLAPHSFRAGANGKLTPLWDDPRVPAWLREEPRWIKLCVDLRHDRLLGDSARAVLRYADADLVQPALAAAKASETPRVLHPATRSSGDLLGRYLRGEHVAVWNELRSYEAIDRDLLTEARAVAVQTMRRVAYNADLLAGRLAKFGWAALSGELRTKPQPGDLESILQLEEAAGAPLPLSLRVFWEVVGEINFAWDYERGDAPNLGVDLAMIEMDPLCVYGLQIADYTIEQWEDERADVDPEFADPLSLDLAPDYLHKANVSGGSPYGIELPHTGVDPIFANEAHNLPFVDYLRLCFRWGGFPGLERHADRDDVREFVRVMSEGLEPF